MKWTEWKKVSEFNYIDIIYEKKYLVTGGGVSRITFNKPEKLNAFVPKTCEEVCEAIRDANHDPVIGVIVITGVGDKAFCTGADSAVMTSVEAIREVFEGVKYIGIDEYIRRSRKPIIAAVKGYAIGGGNHIAYNCDFTIAADNAIFGQVGPRMGAPADGWIVSNLIRVVGTKKAREIWMLCRQYTAQEALAMGMVNVVVPLEKVDEETDRWCEEILEKSPTCIQVLKACFDSDIDYLDGSSRRFSNRMAPEFVGSEEHKEAIEANREKRRPNFWKFRMAKTSEGGDNGPASNL